MSLEVLLQAAQYIDHPGMGSSGASVTEDSRSSASRQPTPLPRPANTSLVYSDSKGDGLQMSSDGYYLPNQSFSGVGESSRYISGLNALSSKKSPAPTSSSHKRPNKASLSRQSSNCEPSWKEREEKSKRISGMKHNVENRSVHNVLEKNRRAHLKDCFEALKQEVMDVDEDKKASHLAVLRSAVRCIQQLQKEGEKQQKESERMAKERTSGQLRLQELKREIVSQNPTFDIAGCLWDNADEVDSQMTCTAPGSPPAGRYSPNPQRPLHRLSATPDHAWSGSLSQPKEVPSSTTTQETLTDSLPTFHSTRTPGKRNESSDRSSSESRTRKIPAKISVAKILDESKASPPFPSTSSVSPPSSGHSPHVATLHCTRSPTHESSASNEPRRHLPIKLRILQDQQEGLFLTEPKLEDVPYSHSSSPQNHLKTLMYQPADIPIPAMFNQNGFWTADGNFARMPTFYAPQNGFSTSLYQMNQFLVPISAVNGMANGGHLSQGLFMVPTAGGSAIFQCGQLPSIHQMPTISQRPPS